MVRRVRRILISGPYGMSENGNRAQVDEAPYPFLGGEFEQGLGPVFVVGKVFPALDAEIVFGSGAVNDKIDLGVVFQLESSGGGFEVGQGADITQDRLGMRVGVAVGAEVYPLNLMAQAVEFPHQSGAYKAVAACY
ncbi:MAG: hypothetical protein BWX83_01301 [Candidatus Cloacimonetes bacterium ADurb.Bin117]|nr:MAG: hypothetical protein BWX83_01301 [Candidatus Cloacimonetes bacterium ADurb.Bin117]